MTDVVLLNNVDHADLRLRLGHAAAWGDAVNQVVVFPTEFDEAARDYPVVLRRGADEAYVAVALLGLDRDENLFLDGGEWRARHVPIARQRGPFSVGMPSEGDGEPMIAIDLDHPRVSRSEGEPLFLEQGGRSPLLEHMVRVLGAIHAGLAAAGPMYAAWDEAGLIEPVSLRLELDATTRYDVPDCFTVGAARLAALDGATLERLNRAGRLRPAFTLLGSLGNVGRLIELKNARRRAAV